MKNVQIFSTKVANKFTSQQIHKLIKENALHGITVRAVQYISKSEFILYISSPKQIASVKNETYKDLLEKFCKSRIKK